MGILNNMDMRARHRNTDITGPDLRSLTELRALAPICGGNIAEQQNVQDVPDKELISLRFSQAAETYEQSAEVQCRVADRLLHMLDGELQEACTPESLLEIGCCTGLLTGRIMARFPDLQRLVTNDLVQAFEPRVRQKLGRDKVDYTFLAGDIEKIRLPGQFDLILSSSTLHWIRDLPALLARLRTHLSRNGLLAFSLYGPENLLEIRATTDMGLRYRGMTELLAMLSSHYQVLASAQSVETLWFSDPIAVLRHLRSTGVNSLARETWTRSRLRSFIQSYEEQFSSHGTRGQGVSLRYHPLYFVARPCC